MLDPFQRSHNELALVPGSQAFRPNILVLVEDFLKNSRLDVPSSNELGRTRHVQTHERFFRGILNSSFIGFMVTLSEIERQLFEALILHRILCLYHKPNLSVNEKRSNSVLVSMCKQKLVELFLDLDPKDVPSVMSIASLSGIRSHSWSASCEYALACVRTVELFYQVEECWMYLPSIYEMYMLGTDLIVFTEEADPICIQVKQPFVSDTTYYIEYVHTELQTEIADTSQEWLRRLCSGMQRMKEHFPHYTFHPCRVIQPFSLPPIRAEEIEQTKFFLLNPQTENATTKAA